MTHNLYFFSTFGLCFVIALSLTVFDKTGAVNKNSKQPYFFTFDRLGWRAVYHCLHKGCNQRSPTVQRGWSVMVSSGGRAGIPPAHSKADSHLKYTLFKIGSEHYANYTV